MKDFGKFAPFSDETGFSLRNEDEEDLATLLAAHPHPFYIAVDDMSLIVEMTASAEKIQIPSFNIVGIDSDFGLTSGAGGNVYGAIWDGNEIIVPQPIISLSARQFWLAALEIGITEAGLLAAISDETNALYIEDATERAEVSIDIAKATTFRRDYPLVDEMAQAYGITAEQMDTLFSWAAQIE